jgi:ATPase family associated with various cellular activities (AAA)
MSTRTQLNTQMKCDVQVVHDALARLRDFVEEAVRQRAEHDPRPDDPFRGLHQTQDSALWLLGRSGRLTGPPSEAWADSEPGLTAGWPRLHLLAQRFELLPLDVAVLAFALAPDLDRGFEACYGYLNDDVTRRRATVGLALELCGAGTLDPGARARFGAGAPLTAGGLLKLEDADRPLPTRGLRVPDRIVGFLLGADEPDDELAGLITVLRPPGENGPVLAAGTTGIPGGLIAALSTQPLLVQLRERTPGSADALAVALLHAAGREAVQIELSGPVLHRADALAPLVVREARLRGAGLVVLAADPADPSPFCDPAVPVLLVGPVQLAAENGGTTAGRAETTGHGSESHGRGGLGTRRPLVIDVSPDSNRSALWQAELGPTEPGLDLATLTAPYRLPTAGIRRAAHSARTAAMVDGVPVVTAVHIHRGVRLENTRSMGSGVRHLEPAVGWADLVLPPEPAQRLRELADRIRLRDRVLGSWRLRPGGGRGRGVTALFAGDSGTGKTLAAEVLAAELGLDLYVIELSALVDKYVGETEKNLERLFTEADRINAVFLFDEADAVFGKRSETKDAHDRYANMESSYLLQRLESFNGVAVLTTNLRSNIDDAFTRRFDLVVDFPFPDAALRRALWEQCLSGPVPVAPQLELDRIAAEFELAGGSIRAAVVTAAYLAAAAGQPVDEDHLLTGARREYRKMGRLMGDEPLFGAAGAGSPAWPYDSTADSSCPQQNR